MALEREQQTYEEHLNDLLPQIGKFVLIRGTEVVDVYAAYEDALKAGYERFGTSGFMVKKIEAQATVHYFSRDIESCHI